MVTWRCSARPSGRALALASSTFGFTRLRAQSRLAHGAEEKRLENIFRPSVTLGVLLDVPRVKARLAPARLRPHARSLRGVATPKVYVAPSDALLVRTGQIAICRSGGLGRLRRRDAADLSFHAGLGAASAISPLAPDTGGWKSAQRDPEHVQPAARSSSPAGLLFGEIFRPGPPRRDCARTASTSSCRSRHRFRSRGRPCSPSTRSQSSRSHR